MGEIKSTLELAMERTRKLAISEEERREIKRQELLKKTTGLCHRYMEGGIPLQEVLKEIERMADEERRQVEEVLLAQWIEALSLKSDHERLLEAIESLKGKKASGVREAFRLLVSEYEGERRKAQEDMAEQIMEELRACGISGTAVIPRVEGHPGWEERCQRLEALFQKRLGEIKSALTRL